MFPRISTSTGWNVAGRMIWKLDLSDSKQGSTTVAGCPDRSQLGPSTAMLTPFPVTNLPSFPVAVRHEKWLISDGHVITIATTIIAATTLNYD